MAFRFRENWKHYLVLAIVFMGFGLLLAQTGARQEVAKWGYRAKEVVLARVMKTMDIDVRSRLFLEHPELIDAIKRGGSFGGQYSRAIAHGMFTRTGKGVKDARKLTTIEEMAPRTWLIRLPIVNAVLFETDEGLVLVDAGMAPGGPAILDAIRKVSDKPLHTVIYTHGHVDHAYGTWALLEAGETPQIIAQENLIARFKRYIRLRGSIAKYMSQPVEFMPKTEQDLVWPTRTFRDRLELVIGGEKFVLVHASGETDDQLYVWVPGRAALASADYYQGFLPNAGNGKRVQRDVESWAQALRDMVALEPQLLLPAHGEPIKDPVTIRKDLSTLAEALQFIVDRTIEGLNAELRKDQIFQSIELPDRLRNDPTLREQYVSAKDISKMVIKQYTGWWDDIPSHWTPSPLEVQARDIVVLAGGIDRLIAHAWEVANTDLQLACHLTDWAFLAEPENPEVQRLVIEIYRRRILDPHSNTQEMLTYLDAMAAARTLELERKQK